VKILACHNRYAVRGGEDIAFDTAVSLWRSAGHRVRVFERDNRTLEEGSWWLRWRAARRAVFDAEVAGSLERIIADTRPEVAVVQNTFPLMSLAPYRVLKANGVPVVQVIYNYRYLCLNGELYTGGAICERCAGGNYLHGVVRRCYRGSLAQSGVAARVAFANRREQMWGSTLSRYVVPDRFLAAKLSAFDLPLDRFRVIPNPAELRAAPEPLNHDGSVLFVGRWTKAKGVFTLLEAALAPGVPPIVMVGGGGGEQRAVESHSAVLQGRVRLVGREYGHALYQRLSTVAAVVVPSEWYDNLPMIVSQAFVAARPVIASRINGIPEYVRDGVNGFLVPPGDPSALADALRAIVLDPTRWARLATAARVLAETELGPERWITNWNEVFAELGE